MGHGKLRKFAENETFACLLQPDASAVLDKQEGSKALHLHDHPVKGNWNRTMFAVPRPIVLELGCGKGDYTIALARRHPEYNFIGVDIKGARLWKGAKEATGSALPNVAFLRTRIEFIEAFFGPSEVSEIWLTFSDPQLKSENSRLTSPLFLERYRRFLAPGGIVHLKTDSRFLHEYTCSVLRINDLEIIASGTDIYQEGMKVGGISVGPQKDASVIPDGAGNPLPDLPAVFEVQTFYEKMFLEMGLPITYLAFRIDHEGPYRAPSDFDTDFWRAAEGPRRTFSHHPAKKV
ncbi:MAG: tRNA (guanosine(46)-N7)-methyltransferase TrmB [Bacteroidales bacterium]|nr:tRNA (guanosine(46)-N7)-methyltransferase TrmB [Bacteroidales bacterium]